MKRFINKGTGLIVVGLMMILGGSYLAFGQALPIPFTGLTTGTIIADAGNFAGVTVNGPILDVGTTTGDAGIFNTLNITSQSGTSISAYNLTYSAASGAFDTYQYCNNTGSTCITFGGSSNAILPAATIGASGSVVTNAGIGSCALASGACNAVVAGATGASLCVADVEGGNWYVDAGAFTCHVRADAGSATVQCQGGAAGTVAFPGTPTVGIHCFN